MAKLLMITGIGSAVDLASGKKGAFYNTLEEFHKYWERIDIIVPKISRGLTSGGFEVEPLFGNVFLHISPWPLIFHPFWFLKKGIQIYKEQKFDLMTVHEFPPFYNGIGARLLWQRIKVPYVLEIMHISGYPKASNFKEWFYKLSMKLFIRFDVTAASAVRVINKKETPEFLVKAGVSQEKLIYTPAFYIDRNVFKPMSVNKEYDLIFVGRLEPNKGINLFLETVKKLNCRAVIIGNGSLENKIKLKIGNWKLKIDMHGWAKDSQKVAELINKSRILVMPSYNEGGPRVVLEAMACGVPVLATNVGLMPDFADKKAIKIIDWNAEDIANKIKELLENEGERKRLSQAGTEIAKQFEKKEAIRNYADKLKGILG